MTKTDTMTTSESLTLSYLASVKRLLDRAVGGQQEAIAQAAQVIADSMAQGGLLHLFGAGHSHMLVEELCGRAGGLTPVNAILIPRLMLHEDMVQATLLERREELAQEILADQPLEPGDVMLVISNSGRNGLSIEVAQLARRQGLTVIALTAVDYSKTLSSRHSTGLRLLEVVDIVLDNHGQAGDACLEFPDLRIRTGPTSTIVGAVVLNAVIVEVIARLARLGITPPVLISVNLVGPDESGSLAALARAGQRLTTPKDEQH
jgi:uncharacterized phosphosugar-binding protein